MTQTPQHPSEMHLKHLDVVRFCYGSEYVGYTVGHDYVVNENGHIPDDEGIAYPPEGINCDRRFIVISRADDDRWFPVSTRSDWEYRLNADGFPEGRPRKPKVERVWASRTWHGRHGPEFGYVTLTDGKLDWSTFSDKEAME